MSPRPGEACSRLIWGECAGDWVSRSLQAEAEENAP
jgi:hypothetical protein